MTELNSIKGRLERLEQIERRIVQQTMEALSGKAAYSLSLVLVGALNRTVCQSKGFRTLIAARNFPCAAVLLRLQLDTAMRVNALHLVEDAFAVSTAMVAGKQLNRFKDTHGKRLQDAYLRTCLAAEHPWIEEVYRQTSDFVHLSGRHFHSAVSKANDEARSVQISVGGEMGESECDYFEIIDAFTAATEIASKASLDILAAAPPATAENL
ncbi:hypothetical protein [Maricaulis salignorans]|uniref:hypothetical protein n=1 Tax=Maricaulis salignorans TaxID=144026 RepID=UPI003A92AC1A